MDWVDAGQKIFSQSRATQSISASIWRIRRREADISFSWHGATLLSVASRRLRFIHRRKGGSALCPQRKREAEMTL